jgi:hypothetical protein
MAEISGQRFGVVRLSEQQFLPFVRIGPTTPKQFGMMHQTCPDGVGLCLRVCTAVTLAGPGKLEPARADSA